MSLKRVSAAAVFFCFSYLLGGKFWEDRPFVEWTEEQLLELLTDSPWAEEVEIQFGKGPKQGPPLWTGAPGAEARQAGRGGGSWSGGSGGSGSWGSSRGGGGSWGGSRGGGTGKPPEIPKVIVRWESALPVRQALIRVGYLGFEPTVEKIRQFLGDRDSYQISVIGIPKWMAPQDPMEIRDQAFLIRQEQDPITAVKADINWSQDSASLILTFSKDPVLVRKDKRVEFQLELQFVIIRKEFDLNKMGYLEAELAL